METLEHEIKQLIITCLNLEGVTAESIDSKAPLFVEGLGLDSIDALELAMEIRKRYGVRTSADEAQNRKIFSSVGSLAAFVAANRNPSVGQ
jgi:acyl carrier protein